MSGLIDTTEMYLRTIFELVEEEIPPMRARIAERLNQSSPTVSQTVSRMERDGLLRVLEDRTIRLTPEGHILAEDVMRKHRLSECMCVSMIGLDWELAHAEACRWEHVISDDVERRLLVLLDSPTHSPYGNPIPGLERLGGRPVAEPFRGDTRPLPSLVVMGSAASITLVRIGESAQSIPGLLGALAAAGIMPGTTFTARRSPTGVSLSTEQMSLDIRLESAEQLYCLSA